MKLIIAGASGFVATEVIRQSLSIPDITSVIALARYHVSIPLDLDQGADVSKLHSVILDDYTSYPEEVRKQFASADACIWTVAITPHKSRGLNFDEVRRVCQESTLAGLQAIFEARAEADSGTTPFRFMYMSGAATERDQSKTPSFMPQYSLMRGETENRVLAFAAEHNDAVKACIAKPGLITTPGQLLRNAFATILKYVISLANIDVKEVSAAMLHQVINGFEKEPLENDDIMRIGRQYLRDAV